MQRLTMKLGIYLLGGLLLWASCSQESPLPTEGTAVSFSLSGIGADVSTRGEALASGTTVRVVAYKGTSYVADNVYTADASGKLTSTTEMRLIEDTYDFYAVSPALVIASKSTSGPTFTVGQNVDFAAVKVNQKVTKYNGSSSTMKCPVALGELVRKCTRLTFNVELGSDIPFTISALKVMSLTLMGLPTSLTTTGATLSAGSGSGTLTIPVSSFTTSGNKASGSTIVLPKTNGTFTMNMDVQFNGSGVTVTFPSITVASMSFDSGKNHVFTVKLMKDRVGVWASVYPAWTGNVTYNPGLGSSDADNNK